jgi:hypothetical protein
VEICVIRGKLFYKTYKVLKTLQEEKNSVPLPLCNFEPLKK